MSDEQTLRESLSAAFEEHETSENNQEVTQNDTSVSEVATKSDEKQPEEKTEAAPAQEEVPAPHSWSKEEKEFWKELPLSAKQAISRRESDRERVFTKKTQELSTLQKRYSEIDELFEPYKSELLARGATPAQVVRQFIGLQQMLEKDAPGTLQRLAANYGLTPEQFLKAQEEHDPKYSALEQKLSALEKQLEAKKEQETTSSYQMTLKDVQDFGSEVDEKGNSLRPDFENLVPTMMPLVEAFKRNNPDASVRDILDAAYDRARWISPEHREKLIEEESKRRNQQLMENAKKETQKAKRAAVSVSGSPNAATSSAIPKTLRDELTDAWDSSSTTGL